MKIVAANRMRNDALRPPPRKSGRFCEACPHPVASEMVRHFLLLARDQSKPDAIFTYQPTPHNLLPSQCWYFLSTMPNCQPRIPPIPMKSLLLILAAALALTSCTVGTLTPIDPMTMRPSDRCQPKGYVIHDTK